MQPRTRQQRSPDPVNKFNPGDLVEVVPDEPDQLGAHFEAVVVARSTSPRGYTVEYENLIESEGSDRLLREVVSARTIRPRPPPRWVATEARAEHAPVDAFLDGGWWLGVDLGGADESGKVRVCFPDIRQVMEFDAADVRPHVEWIGGYWLLRSAFGTAIPKNVPYNKGMQIEVSKLEDNSIVAWLPAVVVKTFWKSNLLVKYTVSKSDGTAFPEEIVDVKHVRPCPLQASAISFCINDEVEAFQGGGWWLGVITDVHPRFKYTFKMRDSEMTIQLSRKSLRLQYNWVDGQWKQKSEKRKTRVDGLPDPAPSLTKKCKFPKVRPSEENKRCGSSSKGIYRDHLEKSPIPESSPLPHIAASLKKRKTRVDGLPDLAPSLTKKRKFPKVRPSEENKRCVSSSKGIYPDHLEKSPLRDAPRPDDQAKPASQPEPTPAPAQRRKGILKLSLPMNQPSAVPDATVSRPARESDAERNEAVKHTVPEVGTCPITPLDVIIEELKGCREQWLKAQSQLHSATKAKELEGELAKLRAASEADAQHLRETMDKQASLQQRLELKDKEIEDLKKKLVDLDEQKSCIEAELPRGAVMAASHALGVLKSHLPDLDVGILSKGYACTPAEAQALADQVRPIVEPFVQRLGLSVVDTFVGRVYHRRNKEQAN